MSTWRPIASEPSREFQFAAPAAQAAAERLGLHPERADWRDAVVSIIDAVDGCESGAVHIGPADGSREFWVVTLCGRRVCAVYQPVLAMVITLRFPPRGNASQAIAA